VAVAVLSGSVRSEDKSFWFFFPKKNPLAMVPAGRVELPTD
jgi:hypothetical protein